MRVRELLAALAGARDAIGLRSGALKARQAQLTLF